MATALKKQELSEEEALRLQEKEAHRALREVQEKRAALKAAKEAEERSAAEEAAKKRRQAELKLLADWTPICRLSGAYDFNEDVGIFTDSTTTIELRQHKKTGKVEAFVI